MAENEHAAENDAPDHRPVGDLKHDDQGLYRDCRCGARWSTDHVLDETEKAVRVDDAPVEILRRAAAKIRREQDIEENLGHISERTFNAWLAVADWLEDEAAQAKSYPDDTLVESAFAAPLRIARAYLGEAYRD